MASRKASRSKEPDVLSAAYLERVTGNKNELLRRLINVTEALSTLAEDVDPSTHPGLLSLSTSLVSPAILSHRDKDIRLHAVLAACEIFYLYAPEPPWEEGEILQIFNQLIRQLGNLHATSPGSSNFDSYFKILEQLSEVKIGVVLVDMIRTERGSDVEGESALETLCELIRTLLNCVHVDHPPEVATHAEMAVAACVEEFEGSVPQQVLEEILTCIGSGPVVMVPNPAFASIKKKKSPASGGKKGKDGEKGGKEQLPPPQIQQTNPPYLLAAKVLRRTEDKISTPIAALLNGLLTGDPNVMEKTSLSTVDAEAAQLLSPKSSGKKKKRKSGGEEDKESPTLTSHLAAKDTGGGANVYSIAYELHRIAPQILTTVIGTVASNLINQDITKRWQATKLLGRLFGARSSDIASRFGPCFREWLRRSYDPEQKVRETMVKCLVNFLTTQYSETDLCADVNEALTAIITRDPTHDIRLMGIHQVCDLAHGALVSGSETTEVESSNKKRAPPISVVAPELLKAIGNRVSSKNKTEHKDAITGLAQIYHKHYLRKKLMYVQEGGDDVSIDEILDVWKETKANSKEKTVEEEKFAWIPQTVFECVSFPDSVDAEMRSRIFQIVDDVLLGTSKKDSGSTLTPTARAVGLALIVASVKQKENAYKWMFTLFTQRSRLQKALGGYLDARSKAKDCESGSAEAFAADSEAMEKLELVASLSAPVPESKSSPGTSDLEAILKKVHSAKDRHIFRILSTIATSTHSPSARVRAFDELPKRTKSLGTAAQSWVKTLARRCSMGTFINAENFEHCIILSQEAFEAEECEVSAGFLECIKLAATIFPSLGSLGGGFKNLVDFFDAVRTTTGLSSSVKRDMGKYGMVTTLSDILARSGASAAACQTSKKGGDEEMEFADDDKSSYDTLREQLLRLCTRDGTPEQARNSVYTISSMIKPPSEQSSSNIASRVRKEKKEFEPLLKALVNPSRLSIPDDTTNPKTRGRIVSILSAIAAIAECAPYAFNAPGEGHRLGWGRRALEFCLDTALLGKNARLNSSAMDDDGSDSDEESSDEELSPVKKGRSKRKSKGSKAKEVSVHCQMLCGAIEVLVAHIRSTIVNAGRGGNSGGKNSKKSRRSSDDDAPKLAPPSSDHIKQVFDALVQILEDGGVPPSSVNGRYCQAAIDKAELRRAASVNLLRLCEANLGLDSYLTPRMWHILSTALLDEDMTVRSVFMEELAHMFTATGKFRSHGSTGPAMAPSLRFVALVTLCADGDHGAHSAANAGAANVGQKISTGVKHSATQCIKQLRTTCQSAAAACRTKGRTSEKNFEMRLKMKLMPEYCVPYALHLLAFRHETACAAGTLAGEIDDVASDVSDEGNEEKGKSGEVLRDQEASQKMLKKRLKWLFDPLIMSLGTGADNISFLLRMIEVVGKHPPINVLKPPSEMSSLEISLDGDLDDAESAAFHGDIDEKEAAARMKIITQFAREVLLSHVKKDVNLSPYPGSIQIPGDLYRARTSMSPPPRAYESEEEAHKRKRPKKSISHYVKKTDVGDEMSADDEKSDEVDKFVNKSEGSSDEHSPDKSEKTEEQLTYEHDHPSLSPTDSPLPSDNGYDFDKEFGDVSPIAKADDSPAVEASRRGGRRKKRSSAAQDRKSTKKSGSTKRKSGEMDIYDEFLESPQDGASKKKSKATPVSVPVKSIMVNVTNSAASSDTASGADAAAGSKKQRASKKKKQEKLSEKDDFTFSDSPVKPKGKKSLSRKKSSASSASGKKAAPARKKAVKTKVSIGKAKVAAKPAGKARASRRSKTTPVEASPSTTSEASSSRASSSAVVRRGARRSARASRT